MHKVSNGNKPAGKSKSMQPTAAASIVASHTKLSPVTYEPLMHRLRQLVRHQWQGAVDRAAARAVRTIDHPGVAADYRMAAQDRR
jgi:hypothetical protein